MIKKLNKFTVIRFTQPQYYLLQEARTYCYLIRLERARLNITNL